MRYGARCVGVQAQGTITRTQKGSEPTVVARGARPGSRIAAAIYPQEHAVVAYLADRKTTEGVLMQAFAVLDAQEPVRISDEGAGATSIDLGRSGNAVVAVTRSFPVLVVAFTCIGLASGCLDALGNAAQWFCGPAVHSVIARKNV